MSGGGGGGSPAYQPVQQQDVKIEPVPQTHLQTEGYGGMGYTQVPQTFTPEAAPSWMQGGTMDLAGQGYQGMPSMEQYGAGGKASPNWYQMPSWGTGAATGEPMTQEQLQPKAYEPPPPPEEAAAPVRGAPYTPRALGGGGSWLSQYQAGVMSREDATKMLRAQGLSNVEAQRRLNMTRRDPMALVDKPLVDWG